MVVPLTYCASKVLQRFHVWYLRRQVSDHAAESTIFSQLKVWIHDHNAAAHSTRAVPYICVQLVFMPSSQVILLMICPFNFKISDTLFCSPNHKVILSNVETYPLFAARLATLLTLAHMVRTIGGNLKTAHSHRAL